jgi:phosphatidyl-myo-inositol dimannoside synthase
MQRVAVDLQRALAARDDIELLTLVLESDARWTGMKTIGFIASLLHNLTRIVRENQVDVVLFSSMVTASIVVPLREKIAAGGAITAAIPVGRDITLDNPAYQWFVRRVLRRLDLILPISRATAETALVRGASPDRVHVVPCGVDLPELSVTTDRVAARQALIGHLSQMGYPVAEDALLLLSVGRHQKRKGFYWFIDEVVPELPTNAVYLLAGTGPMTVSIETVVREKGLEDRVHLLGQVSEDLLVKLYRGADLFIMPNIPVPGDIEGFGVVMIEAGAAGLPVVAADLEGIRDVITPGENGRLVPAGNADAFVREIGRYADPILRRGESARSARHVRATFGWAGIADRHLRLIQNRLASVRHDAPPASDDRDQSPEHLGEQPDEERTENVSKDHGSIRKGSA